MSKKKRPYALDTGWQDGIHGDLDGQSLVRYARTLEFDISRLTAENERLELNVDAYATEINAKNDLIAALTEDNRRLGAVVQHTERPESAAVAEAREAARWMMRESILSDFYAPEAFRRWPWLEE